MVVMCCAGRACERTHTLTSPSPDLSAVLCCCSQLIEANQLPAALLLVRSQLTPLAEKHPELLPALKASMALLLPGSSSTPSGGATSAAAAASKLWDSLLPLLQARMGLEQPRLVQLLAVLLTAHRAWFRLQRCSDPFASALAITQLQQAPSSAAAAAAAGQAGGSGQQAGAAAAPGAGAAGQMARLAAGAAVAAAAGGGPGAAGGGAWEVGGGGGAPSEYGTEGGSDGGMMEFDDGLEGDEEGQFDEASVLQVRVRVVVLGAGQTLTCTRMARSHTAQCTHTLQVMEVLELPRPAALELLAEHGGDAQAVIMALFGA
jgi:hypothetical protein